MTTLKIFLITSLFISNITASSKTCQSRIQDKTERNTLFGTKKQPTFPCLKSKRGNTSPAISSPDVTVPNVTVLEQKIMKRTYLEVAMSKLSKKD